MDDPYRRCVQLKNEVSMANLTSICCDGQELP